MSKACENAIAHFKTRLGDVRIIEVKEWGDENEPLKIYVRPISMAEKDEIMNASKTGVYHGVVMSLIVRARDEEGKHLFQKAELGELMKKADPDVISSAVTRINKVFDEPVTKQEAEGELDTIKKQ